jgi:hypothetical protein
MYKRGTPATVKYWEKLNPVTIRNKTDIYVRYSPPSGKTKEDETTAKPADLYSLEGTHTITKKAHALSQPVSMTFKGTVNGVTAVIGTDSFAEGTGYMSTSFAEINQIKTQPSQVNIILADGHTQASSSAIGQVHIKMGSYHSIAWLQITALPEGVNILLGDEWLCTNKAHLQFDRKVMVIQNPNRKHTIYTEVAKGKTTNTTIRPTKIPTALLSAMQVKKAQKQNLPMVLCMVTKAEKDKGTESHEGLDKLLQKYKDVFPEVLPGKEHRTHTRIQMPEVIPTVPGAKIPNRPMFRYSPGELKGDRKANKGTT